MKTALVTGSSRGIGAAVARCLHRDGWKVYINYFESEEKALALAAELGTEAIRADVSDPEQVSELFRRLPGIDLLVNNAGIVIPALLLQDVSNREWRRLTGVNLDGMFYCCRAAIPHMVSMKSGAIINISSVCGVCGSSAEAAYSATKAAVIGLTRSLAKELGPSGIRVNSVAPGVIATDMTACFSAGDMAAMADETPLGRIGTPEDIAELVAFLASDRASFITNQVIGCDGGFSL